MLFNSYEYILVFLPIMFIGYFVLQKLSSSTLSKCFLLLGSLVFYAWWEINYLPLLLGSITLNFMIGRSIGRSYQKNLETSAPEKQLQRKWMLGIGILFNLGLLGYYKYADFFIVNFNLLRPENSLDLLKLTLPLAISFFTFQQIAYLVDSFKGQVKDYGLLNYAVFVSFFPQLIAGPIVHHQKILPQLNRDTNRYIHWENVSKGLFIFSLGLFKKVIIADQFAVWANAGHLVPQTLSMLDAWACSLSYTLQLYYDFSGYSDMAIGAGLLFNIRLPLNFNSPYKAADIRDFWRRWHMTLGDFMTRYVYGFLGGRKKGVARLYANLFIVFLVIGIWHGAGWTFVVFGLMHGSVVVLHQAWKDLGMQMPYLCGWFLTFNFFNLSVVTFRATDMDKAIAFYKAMFGFNGVYHVKPELMRLKTFFGQPEITFGELFSPIRGDFLTPTWLVIFFLIAVLAKNSVEMSQAQVLQPHKALFAATLFTAALIFFGQASEFLYFNF